MSISSRPLNPKLLENNVTRAVKPSELRKEETHYEHRALMEKSLMHGRREV